MKELVALTLIGVLLVSAVPLGAQRPEELLDIAFQLANYTKSVNCTSPEGLLTLERARELYESGQYNLSLELTLRAMEEFRRAVESCPLPEEPPDSVTVELVITRDVLNYTKAVLPMVPEELRDDVESAYNETLSLYNLALSGSVDVGELIRARKELEELLERAMERAVLERAPELVRIQLQRMNCTQDPELELLCQRLERAVERGDNEEALALLKMVSKRLTRFETTYTVPGRPSYPDEREELPDRGIKPNQTQRDKRR